MKIKSVHSTYPTPVYIESIGSIKTLLFSSSRCDYYTSMDGFVESLSEMK